MYSRIHEIEQIKVQADGWLSEENVKSSAWMVLIPLMLIGIVGGVAFYFVQRHRRTSNSFSRFANSHYNTQTGATRIGDAIEEDDHHRDQDVPRFDDDEPLVLT